MRINLEIPEKAAKLLKEMARNSDHLGVPAMVEIAVYNLIALYIRDRTEKKSLDGIDALDDAY